MGSPITRGSSIRPQQTTQPLDRFKFGVHIRLSVHRHDQLVAQPLMTSIVVIVFEELFDGISRRRFAKKDQPVQALRF